MDRVYISFVDFNRCGIALGMFISLKEVKQYGLGKTICKWLYHCIDLDLSVAHGGVIYVCLL